MLAKISTDINKPNGQYRLAADRTAITSFLRDLPIRKIPGIGRVMERLLTELGIATVGQMVRCRKNDAGTVLRPQRLTPVVACCPRTV